jgi:hypothetical protein
MFFKVKKMVKWLLYCPNSLNLGGPNYEYRASYKNDITELGVVVHACTVLRRQRQDGNEFEDSLEF